jgi:hypothetical protein
MPVAIVNIFKSKIISYEGKFNSSVRILYALLHILTLSSTVAAYPYSSNAITITAAPYYKIVFAYYLNSSSPTFKEILLTIHFP